MTWEADVFQAFPVGTEMTVPDIAKVIAGKHTDYPPSGVRSKIYTVLGRNAKYGIIEKLGTTDKGVRIWRRKL